MYLKTLMYGNHTIHNTVHTCIKFRGLNFHVFDWQDNSRGINFHDHGGVVGTFVVEYARYKLSWCINFHG